MPVSSWSTTASSNATADAASGISWPEGMAPSQINDSARAMMAEIAKWRDTMVISKTNVTSAVASVDFTLPSGYRYFRVVFWGIKGSVDGALLAIRWSQNGGSSWFTTAGDYFRQVIVTTGATAVGAANSATETLGYITGGIQSATNSHAYGECKVFPGSASAFPVVFFQTGALPSGGGYETLDFGTIRSLDSSGINAIRFLMSSGNIVAGQFTLEGIQ